MGWLKRNLFTMILVLIMLAGVGLVAYPTVSNLWNRHHQAVVIDGYVDSVRKLSAGDYAANLEAARAWNQGLIGRNGRLSEPEFGDLWDEYNEILNIDGSGSIGYVEVPKIDAKIAIYHGTDENVLQIAAGHLYGSSFPVGGTGTHAVLSGHTGLPRAKLFTGLEDMQIGDVFMITVLDELLTYQVDQIKIVLPEDTSYLQIDPNEDWCTLVTCTPYGVNSHRLLVRGTRIENIENNSGGHFMTDMLIRYLDLYVIAAAAVLTLLSLVVTLVIITRRRRR